MRKLGWKLFSIGWILAALGGCPDDPPPPPPEVCGDGTINGPEQCDGAALGGQDCTDEGFDAGTLACNADCTFNTDACTNDEDCNVVGDEDNDGDFDCADADCSADPDCIEVGNCDDGADNDVDGDTDCADAECANDPLCAVFVCGNNLVDGNDECDGADLAGQDCLDQGFDAGTLACNANCTFNTDGCVAFVCGDGVANGTDQCDGADLSGESCVTQGFDSGNLACNADCTFNTNACANDPVCGNNVVEVGEQCDDGNTNAGDGCDAACQIENNAVCGDGLAQAPEQCDDGNVVDNDGCSAACTLEVGACTHDVCTEAEALVDGCDAPATCVATVCAADSFCCDVVNGAWDGICVQEAQDLCGLTCTLPPEVACNDIADDDGDGLFDCQDADCAAVGQCTPGAGIAGDPCTANNDCSATGGDPLCIDEAQFGFPLGSCSEYCDLAAPVCSGDALCADIGLGASGICLDSCTVNSDCRADYTCQDALGTGDLLCFPGDEVICNDGLDDNNNGLVDCADPDCGVDPVCVVCGDGVVGPGEDCDDGNTNNGDGCDANCQFEPPPGSIVEVEPNENSAQATDLGTPDAIGAGSTDDGVAGNIDFFSITLTAGTIIDFETSGFGGLGTCDGDTVITLFDVDGVTVLATNDDGSGVGLCSLINDFVVPADGQYFISVEEFNAGTVTDYLIHVTDVTPVCGNNTVEVGEQCDGADLGGNDCTTIGGFGAGTLACAADCTFDTGACVPGVCGDGITDPTLGEQCDDGNVVDGDGCNALCQVEIGLCAHSICAEGDALPEIGCQDPAADPTNTCVAQICAADSFCCNTAWDGICVDEVLTVCGIDTCAALNCGNGVIDAPEQCDGADLGGNDCTTIGGFGAGTLACDAACNFDTVACVPGVCGDGITDPTLGEQCDDGNNTNGDGCDAACQAEIGLCEHPICTAGNALPAVGCQDPANDPTNTCVAQICAVDGFCCNNTWDDVCVGEVQSVCGLDSCVVVPVCGNGAIEGNEQCDDGNVVDGDGCSAVCTVEIAGVINETEPNDTSAEADALGIPDAIGGGSILGADADFFSIDLTAGTALSIETSDNAGLGSCGGGIDTLLDLFDVDGATILVNNDDGGPNLCSLITTTVPATGTFFIRVTSFNASDVPAYLVHVNAQ